MICSKGPSPRTGAAQPLALRVYLEAVYPLWHPNIDPKTLKSYGYAVGSLERFAGPVMLSDLDETLILEWIHRRLSEVSRKTVKRERCDILVLWRSAADLGYCRQPGRIPTITAPSAAPISWTPGEYRKLIATCRRLPDRKPNGGIHYADGWTALLTFLYWTGARIGAALLLTWRDVDLVRGFATLRWKDAKTNIEQVVRLNPQAVAALEAISHRGSEVVFPAPKRERTTWNRLKRILRLAGLPFDRYHMFHCVRKTTYTQMAIHAGIEAAGRQCGHKTDLSRIYLDVSQLPPVQAADVLPTL